MSWAASRAWYSESSRTPSASSLTPSFFLIPALKAGSKSRCSLTLDAGLTRNGAMNSSKRFRRLPARETLASIEAIVLTRDRAT